MKNDTVDQATGLRIVCLGNITDPRRRIGETWSSVEDLVDVAYALDKAHARAISRAGGCGIGAGAYLEAVFHGDDPSDPSTPGEQVISIDDDVFHHLPLGSRRRLRKLITEQRNTTCWDGHNHIPAPCSSMLELLHRMKQQKK